MRILPIVLISLGLLFVLGFVILGWVVSPMFHGEKVVQGMQQIYGPTGGSEHWKKFGLPSYLALNPPLLYVYLFNVTNPLQVIQDGVKPILQQVGPYVYTINKEIEIVPSTSSNINSSHSHSHNNNSSHNETETEPQIQIQAETTKETVTFREKTIYHFNPELSGPLRETDEVMTINIPFLKFLDDAGNSAQASGSNVLVRSLLVSKENGNSLFIQRPIKQLLFSGFAQHSLNKSQKIVGRNSAPITHDGKFGFFYPKNGSTSGLYTVYASFGGNQGAKEEQTVSVSTSTQSTWTSTEGESSERLSIQDQNHNFRNENDGEIRLENIAANYARIQSYDGKSSLDYWARTGEDKCNRISGTTPDGMLFNPMEKQGPTLTVFRPEMCRPLTLLLSGPVEEYSDKGLKGFRYALPQDALADSKVNFDNNCFCPNPTGDYGIKGCVVGGTLSNCREGFPYITTLPHFLDSDGAAFVTQSVGLEPNRTKHESYIDLEPITGLALKSSMKFQINYELKLTHGFSESLRKVPEMMFPILWTNEVKSLNFVLTEGIEKSIMTPLKLTEVSKWGVLVAGCILIIVGLLVGFLRSRRKNYPLYFNTLLISKESLSPTAAQRQKAKQAKSRHNRKVSFASKISSHPKTPSQTPSPSYGEEFYDDGDDIDEDNIEDFESSTTMPSLSSPVSSEPFLEGLYRQASRTSKASSTRSSVPSIIISNGDTYTILDTNSIENTNTSGGLHHKEKKPSVSNSSSLSSSEYTNPKAKGKHSRSKSNGSSKVVPSPSPSPSIHEIKKENGQGQVQGQGQSQGQGQGQDADKEEVERERATEITVMLTSDETML